jgi:hypothetical protein
MTLRRGDIRAIVIAIVLAAFTYSSPKNSRTRLIGTEALGLNGIAAPAFASKDRRSTPPAKPRRQIPALPIKVSAQIAGAINVRPFGTAGAPLAID